MQIPRHPTGDFFMHQVFILCSQHNCGTRYAILDTSSRNTIELSLRRTLQL